MRKSRFAAAAIFVAAAVLVVEAQPMRPGGLGGFGGINTLVLTNKILQEELKITTEQKEKFKGLTEKQTEAFKKQFEGFKEAAGDMDKIKELVEKNKKASEKLNEEITKAVDETLTGEQKTRLKQIERQIASVGGFLKEDVAKDLELTDGQKSKIKGIADEFRKDVGELLKSGGGSFKDGKFTFDKEKFAANQEKQRKLTKAAMGDIDDVLTDDQRKKWKVMIGEPFDTSKLFQFGAPPKTKEKTKD